MKKKSLKSLEKYLKWLPKDEIDKNLFRRSFYYAPNGIKASKAMIDWEGRGIDLPSETCEPDLLSDYVQGKILRDWHISEWNKGISDGSIFPRELVGVGECETIEDVNNIISKSSMSKGINKLFYFPN